ncbi:MAG: hypothetical protein ABW352_12310 [Polyangiales bacterium]
MVSRRLLACATLLAACQGALGSTSSAPGEENDPPPGADGGRDGSVRLPDGRVAPPAPPELEDDGGVPSEFAPLSVRAYVSKVKSVLTALPPSEHELRKVEANPGALPDLIEAWQATPEYHDRMLSFFTMAFQQGDVTNEMLMNVNQFQQINTDPRIMQNMRESFGRTVLQLIAEGKPFSDVLSTRRYMLTPALAMFMAWLDERSSGDGGGVSDLLDQELGQNGKYTLQGDTKIPLEQSVDPASPNFLNFYSAQVAAMTGDCRKPLVIDRDNRLTLYTMTQGETLMRHFLGNPFNSTFFCNYAARETVLNRADFNSWKMVNLRQPRSGEKATWVYQIPKFRSGEELVFRRPYVGFYTTPSFLYNWQTNTSNQARVTINQTILVATGQKFDASHNAMPVSTAAIETSHAMPGTACYACHLAMDPMRQFFRSTYTLYWSVQSDSKQLPPVFVLGEQSTMGNGIASLGESMKQSDRFASAWVQKLCIWANGAVCDPSGSTDGAPSDPELLRIAALFADGYDWNAMVRTLMSSPLVTYSAPTATSMAQGHAYSIAKKDLLCRRWDHTLGLDDACGLGALPSTQSGDAVKTIATVLPADSYSRGQSTPVLANDPGMFFFAGVENACAALAARVVDVDGAPYQSRDVDGAIAKMVHELMGIPAPDDVEPIAILKEHFSSALADGAAPALRSTFMLACLSPSTVSVGQ